MAGLVVGSFILPAIEVEGVENDAWYFGDGLPFCFVTVDLLQAWHNTCLCEQARGAGMVYRVEPIGPLRSDNGSRVNFACRRARI